MAGTEFVANLRIIFGALIDIFDQKRNWRAGRDLAIGALVFEDFRQDFHLIGFATLGREARLAGPPFVEKRLNLLGFQRYARRQPSTTQPIATPWLSPKVVMRNMWPKVL